MIESEQVEHGGVEVVEVDLVLDRIVPVFVGGAMTDARLDTASGQEHRQRVRVVVSTVVALCHRCSPEFPAPEHQCVFEQSSLLEVTDEAVDRLIDFHRVSGQRFLQSSVLVPLVAVRDLDESNASFGEPSRHQALPSEVLGGVVVETVELVDVLGFAADVLQLRSFTLHPKCEFE